jgi:hypothetical protein
METITAVEILKRLIFKRSRRSFVMPNFTPCGWFECDLWEVTKPGYGVEYEVKVSRGDFFADASKQCWVRVDGKRQPRVKHYDLRDRLPHAPSRFYFVVPAGLVRLDEIPEWAGLIEIDRTDRGHVSERLAKAAPKLHGKKVDPSVIERAKVNAYYRYIQVALARAK